MQDQPTRPWWQKTWVGWTVFALGLTERIVGWGGSIDFLLSRSADPGWVGSLFRMVADASAYFGTAFILAGLILIIWNERKRADARLDGRVAHALATINNRDCEAGVPAQSQDLFPDWDLIEVYNGIIDDNPVPDDQETIMRHHDNVLLLIADQIALNSLRVWGRYGRLPIQEISLTIFKRGVLAVAGGRGILTFRNPDNGRSEHFDYLQLNREQAEQVFFDVTPTG